MPWLSNPTSAQYVADRIRKSKYGLTAEQYRAMLERQHYRCAICKQMESARNSDGERKNLSVDHNHACCDSRKSCGACVRDLLCGRCNRLIQLFEGEPALLEEMRAYLLKHQL